MKYIYFFLLFFLFVQSAFSLEEAKPPWRKYLLGAQDLAQPGIPLFQIKHLFGEPSFIDENGDFWYQVTKPNTEGFVQELVEKMKGGFVVFRIENEKLIKVDLLCLVEFKKTIVPDTK